MTSLWNVFDELQLRNVIRELETLGRSFSAENIQPSFPDRNEVEISEKLLSAGVIIGQDTANLACVKLAHKALRDNLVYTEQLKEEFRQSVVFCSRLMLFILEEAETQEQ